MNILVFDTESDGLLHEATKIHCAVTKTNTTTTDYTPHTITVFLTDLSNLGSGWVIVGHNILCHDLPLMEKLYGYVHKGAVLDTLVMSRLLRPERVGRHSIEAWGERFGVPKPTHDEWHTYSASMLLRCRADTRINWLVYEELMREAEIDAEELVCLPEY